MGFEITALDLARRFLGIREVSGMASNPQILAMLRLDESWPTDDSVAWCSAFVNYIAWLLDLPRSEDLRARSWLSVGQKIELREAIPGFDIVILKRGPEPQPGPDVMNAPGHVGFFVQLVAMADDQTFSIPGGVQVLGGNQGDEVTIEVFPISRIIGVRRLWG